MKKPNCDENVIFNHLNNENENFDVIIPKCIDKSYLCSLYKEFPGLGAVKLNLSLLDWLVLTLRRTIYFRVQITF